ncbi:hypothetical protein [Leptospira kmetyi]|uniref:Uncharacterized protein n=1 Tax=Leptospira kmetyi TaxID=408139 RepID=A0A5F1XQ42_9LEPT|nr:hypothetical protein [Leptospira kmetyi]AYV56068.1 hypothetical protein EFP84_11485 [Leptospira kmetyi]EQA53687.1 hypothetical protein LEP1GSC052_3689 [Leptospira kmetyi serovar Malaysia str. Bejo-Iso9]TGK16112.1 hypothetical protein EHO62_10145 [Leptospira kmetyi]TGK32142.1 hypothetical protein EHO66_07125 [Leptospira kmetyi]TGL66044.1 hypothetical protein EHQ67_16585 [Leptospira kmetyi]
MKVTHSCLEFDSIEDLIDFTKEFETGSMIRFLSPIEDNSGNVLVKEEVQVKESALARLKDIKGQYTPKFDVKLNKELLEQIQNILAMKIVNQLKISDMKFLKFMYENTTYNYKGIIRNSLLSKKTVLALLKVYIQNVNFFRYISELGLLTLGIVMIPDTMKFRLLRRYAFTAGILMDIPRIGVDRYTKLPSDDSEKVEVAKKCSDILQKLDLVDFTYSAISNHMPLGMMDNPDKPISIDKTGEGENLDDKFLDDIISDDGESDSKGDSSREDAIPEKSYDFFQALLTDALKLARYIANVSHNASDKDYVMEELVYYIAYNTSKKYFDELLANPLVSIFKDFEVNVKRMRKIAEVEMKCVYPPSAWAYPKPKSSQVLCKNKVWGCPNIVMGWDIHVITAQEAFGWVGTSLPIDNYPKCKLEEELDDIMVEPEKPKKK